MNEMNSLPTNEKDPAENTERIDSGIDKTTISVKLWGVIVMAGLSLLVIAYLAVPVIQQEIIPPIGYIALAVYLLGALLNVISVVMAFRQRQEQALKWQFYFILALLLAVTTLYQGRTLTASIAVMMIAIIMIMWLLPRSLWRRYTAFSTGAFLLTWVIEWINPAWRIQVEARGVAITAVVAFAFVLAAMVAREAWKRNNIRSRFLTLSLGLTLLASVIIAVISVNSLFSAGEQAQEVSSRVLRNQVQSSLSHQTIETAAKNDLILQGISQDAQGIAQQATYILEHPNAFNTESYWKADEHMFLGPEGQYINSENDTSTLFIPNTVTMGDNLKKKLETLAFLDMAFAPVYESDPNSVAIYFTGRGEITWYYPNISLGTFIPPDYLATQDIFYTSGTPENDPERQVVWTPVYDDPAGHGLLVSAVAPVYVGDTFEGIIGIDVSLANLTTSIETEDFGSEGTYAFLLDSEGNALALPEQGYIDLLGRERQPGEFGVDFANSARSEFAPILDHIYNNPTGFHNVVIDDQEYLIAHAQLSATNWYLVSVASADQVLAPATTLRTELAESASTLISRRILPVGIVIIIVVLIAGYYFTNVLAKPLEQLTAGAAKIGTGDWDTDLPKSEIVEIGGLSQTLSQMAMQIKGTLETLEQRVAERTENLELAAEVGRTVSQVSDLETMLTEATQLILEQFDLYYVQIYLTDPGQTLLKLEAGTGEVGKQLLERGHSLPLSIASVNGRAAFEKHPVVIPDTAESSTFRKNPLLPDTRGEMALPLIVGDKVVGVLDMQTRYPDKLTEELLPAYEALAGQLAVAIQNANLLAETEQARAEVEAQARRQARTNWGEYLDAIHKPEQIGYIYDRNEVLPFNAMEADPSQDEGQAVSSPIYLSGEELGSLVVEIDNEKRKEQTGELVTIVARQVAQQIENLRLLESAERFRHEAEEAFRRQTAEGWQAYVASRTTESLGYLYDRNEVRPHSNGQDDATALTLPLKVRDEAIGKMAVQGLSPNDRESFELVNAVAERLSAHIESLRQYDQTQSALSQSEKLFNASRRLTESTGLQELVAAVVETLGIPVVNRAVLGVFDYGDNDEFLSMTIAANWWNGLGHEATPVGTHYPVEVFKTVSLFASTTPVFFNDAFQDPRADETTLALVKRQNLRAVAILPLFSGARQVGVFMLEAEEPHNFRPEETRLFTSLAPQITTVLENRRQFERAQKQAEREGLLNTISQKIQSATSVEAVLQIAARELGHALGAPMTVAQLSLKDQN